MPPRAEYRSGSARLTLSGNLPELGEERLFARCADAPFNRDALASFGERLAGATEVEEAPLDMRPRGGDEIVVRLVEIAVVVLIITTGIGRKSGRTQVVVIIDRIRAGVVPPPFLKLLPWINTRPDAQSRRISRLYQSTPTAKSRPRLFSEGGQSERRRRGPRRPRRRRRRSTGSYSRWPNPRQIRPIIVSRASRG